MVTVLVWTADGAGFESWFSHPYIVVTSYVIGLISWAHMAQYSLCVLKGSLNTDRPTVRPTDRPPPTDQHVCVFSVCLFYNKKNIQNMGYWHQRADERHGNPPQGNLELLVVRDKVGRPPGELGLSKSVECDIFPSVL